MNIVQVYQRFSKQKHCLQYLEKIRWNNKPVCPYCESPRHSKMKKKQRYHCNACNTSYSVTVNTIFHNTKIDIQRWFVAITLVLNAKKGISARQLARDIDVNKNTAWFMLMRLRKAMVEEKGLLKGIVEADETYIGGKLKNKHSNKRFKNSQGRSLKDKIAVFGMIERGGAVRAYQVNHTSKKYLQGHINRSVKKGSRVMTDEWRAYNGLEQWYIHEKVYHSAHAYVRGDIYTNSIESFWAILKRGITGQYHTITAKHINSYLNEFCFKHNNRKNEFVFELLLNKSLHLKSPQNEKPINTRLLLRRTKKTEEMGLREKTKHD